MRHTLSFAIIILAILCLSACSITPQSENSTQVSKADSTYESYAGQYINYEGEDHLGNQNMSVSIEGDKIDVAIFQSAHATGTIDSLSLKLNYTDYVDYEKIRDYGFMHIELFDGGATVTLETWSEAQQKLVMWELMTFTKED